MLGLDNFSFADVWSPIELLVYIVIAAAYLLLTGPYRALFPNSEPVTWKRKSMFLIGLALLYLAQSGPVEVLAHLMFSAHMIAMAMSYIIAPPLLIMGVPAWIWRPIIKLPFLGRLKPFMHPIFTIGLFNALFSLYHMPVVLDYVMSQFTLHTIVYIVLFITSLMMWWPMVCPVPEYNRMTELQKMGYIFVSGVLLTPACALIIFAPNALYETYTNPLVWASALTYCIPGDPAEFLALFEGPGYFSSWTPLEHQQIGGIAMKIIQEILYGSILGWVFLHWFRREKRQNMEQDDEAVILEWRKRMNQA